MPPAPPPGPESPPPDLARVALPYVIALALGSVLGLVVGLFRTGAPDRWNAALALALGAGLGLVILSDRVNFDTGRIRPPRARSRAIVDDVLSSGRGRPGDPRRLVGNDRPNRDRDDRVLPALRDRRRRPGRSSG